MKFSSLIVLSAFCFLLAGSLRADSDPNTVVRDLPRTRPDRIYQLTIGLPPSFREHPDKKYPVIFVLDGYWGLPGVRSMCGSLFYGKHLPEVLVVGLGYAGENLDYVALRGDDLSTHESVGILTGGGHAERFLELIEKQMIPLLEKEYRADPAHRYLLGGSAGGLFALYALFTKPDLFQGIVADSPSIDVLWNLEREFAVSGRTTNARVFISVAENEWTYYRRQIQAFHRRMAAHGYVKGGLKFRRIDGVRHGAGGSESYMQGLLFVASPIAPEHGVATDLMTDPQGRPGFLAAFWPKEGGVAAPFTAAQNNVWQAHLAYITGMAKDKKMEFAGATPPDLSGHDSAALLFAANRAAAEALVRDDPAVKAGLLAWELIEATE